MLSWIRQNRCQYEVMNKGRVADVDQLIAPCRTNAQHVFVYASHPNTIAIRFHHKRYERTRGIGHFEYLIDSSGRLLWTAGASIVKDCFEIACKQTACFRRLYHYTQRMKVQERDTEHSKRFHVGMLAILHVRQKLREAAGASLHLHQKMYVRLLQRLHPERAQHSYQVLSHAGVVSEPVPTSELAPCGQDVDDALLHRLVTTVDLSKEKSVPLLTAWKFELGRALATTTLRSASASTASAGEMKDDDPPLRRATRSRTAATRRGVNSESPSAADVLTFPPSPPFDHICAACSRPFTLARGENLIRCLGICQQSLHTLASQCNRSTH